MTRSPEDVRLIEAKLPDFGIPETRPELPPAALCRTPGAALESVDAAGLSALLVYGDREHFANLAWATGFDPRFEEALLVLVPGGEPMLLAGPENQGTGRAAPVALDVRLYPPFGLLGQDRRQTPPLADLLAEAGIARGQRVGIAGWKYYGPQETPHPDLWIESPAFIVDTLRRLVGEGGAVVNATALFMHASTGLRAVNEIDQLAAFEFAAVHVSEAVKRVLFGLKPGMRECGGRHASCGRSACRSSCHLMLSAGPRAALGLVSPLDRPIERGDPFTAAYGVWGASTSPRRLRRRGCRRPAGGDPRLCRAAGGAVFRLRRRVVRDRRHRRRRRRASMRSPGAISATPSSMSGSTPATSSISTSG